MPSFPYIHPFKSIGILLISLLPCTLYSASITWNVAGSGAWDTTTANWSSGTFTDGGVDDVTFNNAAGGTITISANMTPNTTTVSAAAGTYTFTGGPIDGGTVTKSGAGTLILSGANSYAGSTSINSGVLNIQNNTALGTTAGSTSVASGAALQIQGSVTVTGENITIVGGGIANNGAIRNISGSNTWTGNVTVTSLAVTRIASDAGNLLISGNIALSPTSSDLFVLQGVGNGEISGVISGVSQVFKSGLNAGTWILSGANTYTGKTTIGNGALSVSSLNKVTGGTASSGLGAPTTVASGTIVMGTTTTAGTLIYTGTGETTDRVLDLAGTTGGATLDQSGTGLLKFSSALTATGAGAKTLTLQGSTTGTGEIAGAIVNSGGGNTSIAKSGTGTWTLSGTNTASGLATISAGTLIIGTATGGNWAGAVTVDSGGTLKGRGGITGAVTINSGGTYSPGNSPGTQTVGSLTLNAGSNTIFKIDGGTAGNGAGFHDQIIVTGAATINGGTITPQTIFTGSSGFTPTAGQTFTVITAGSLTGQFTSVDNTGNPSGLSFIPQYTGTSVILLTSLSSLSSVASVSLMNLNPNQIAVARSLDQFRPTSIDSSPGRVMSDAEVIYQSLGRLTASQTPSAISQLSPEKLAVIPRLSQSFGNQMHSMLSRQLELRRDSLPAQGNLSIYSRDGQTFYEPVAEIGSDNLFIPRRMKEKLSFFASVTGEQGEVKPSERRTNFDYWSASALYGGNYALSNEWNVGLFTGYGHADTNIGGAGGNLLYNSGKFGGYLSWNHNDWFAELSSSVGKGFYETKRNITFLSQTAKGDTEGWESVSDLKMGKDWSYGHWTFRPSILGRYSRTFIDAYEEKGSAARLHLGSMDQSSIVSGTGLSVQRAIPLGKESLIPRIYTNYEREWIRSSTIDARFAAGGDSFTVHSDSIDPDSLTAGVGATWLISERLQWDLAYEQEVLQNDLQRQSVNLSCKFSF